MKRLVVLIALAGLATMSLTTVASAVPNNGNGNKEVVLVEDYFQQECDSGDVLDVAVEGWFQVKELKSKRNLLLFNYAINVTFTNVEGHTWVFSDRGPDRIFVVDGMAFPAVTGRSSFSGVIGHVVFPLDIDTGEMGEAVFQAGNQIGGGGPFAVDDAACAALT